MRQREIRTSYSIVILCIALQINYGYTKTLRAKEPTLDSRVKAAVIESIADLIVERYVFPDVAQRIHQHLATKLTNGDYDNLNNAYEFASVLWTDLQESSNDSHFFIEHNPERARLIIAKKSQSEGEVERANKQMAGKDRLTNFGFKKLEILRGNVGYLALQFFSDPDYAGATAVAAMNFLASSDAVIIDVRGTPGGKETMVQLLSSYFVKGNDRGRRHLNTLEQPYTGENEQYWTIPYVPGGRMYSTDLYVLVDEYTGSAAEAFAYSMKALKRATIVGDTTAGSAHNVDIEVIHNDFVMHMPVRRPVNPVTGTNWEHTGVEPDVAVPAAQALDRAYVMALENILRKTQDPDQEFQVTWALDGSRAKIDPVELDEKLKEKYAGQYGERKIMLENGVLSYQRTGQKYMLIPLKDHLFALEGLDYFRIEMTTDNKGDVTELVGIYDNGRRDVSKRTR